MRNKEIISDYMKEEQVSGEVLPPYQLHWQTMQYLEWLEKKYLQSKTTKLINTLFVGKIVEEIGFDKTTELLKKAKEAFKDK
jgi:hypothetical protein